MYVFDCRISQLPTLTNVVDYFRWRSEDANRNALNSYCYWTLRKNGLNIKETTDKLIGMSVSEKNELLFNYDINYNAIPNWEKRGVGIYWKTIDKAGYNPLKNETVTVKRRQLYVDYDLPMKDEYSDFIVNLLNQYL